MPGCGGRADRSYLLVRSSAHPKAFAYRCGRLCRETPVAIQQHPLAERSLQDPLGKDEGLNDRFVHVEISCGNPLLHHYSPELCWRVGGELPAEQPRMHLRATLRRERCEHEWRHLAKLEPE